MSRPKGSKNTKKQEEVLEHNSLGTSTPLEEENYALKEENDKLKRDYTELNNKYKRLRKRLSEKESGLSD